MKFTSKFGLGEIVNYLRLNKPSEQKEGNHYLQDELLEVIAVSFEKEGVTYIVRGYKGLIFNYRESELEGDPAFDQDNGCYPVDE